ncbi:hypothetical protein [Actinophytocola glycyrrhizae]|uniref:Uncharacterized protein n=1 Tax=Actinophytocola glycyrrhizae TaxID=2044873 RepID=A0ABV9S475_9PSEU
MSEPTEPTGVAGIVGRTVCHGCRQLTQYRGDDAVIRPMILPGSGVVFAEKSPGVMVEVPCPECGDSEDPGWVPGFVPPV